ncbi:MAG: beta-lactamase family protein [Ruminococcaceae bacterium]|nr:beta-lactamase family protein [Oscillospiraceae bacterium]
MMKQLNTTKLEQTIRQRVREDLEAGRVGGAVLFVCQNDRVVFGEAFGNKNAQEQASVGDIYRLASMTKPITAVAILIQAQRGLLALDDAVDKFLPEFSGMKVGKMNDEGQIEIIGVSKEKIRIRHLLTHSSGLISGALDGQFNAMTDSDRKSLKTAVDFYAKTALSFEPFSAQAYSGIAGFDVLARIVEVTSGVTFDKFLQKEIFEPLGMSDTAFQPSEVQLERMVDVHNFKDGVSSFEKGTPGCIFFDIPSCWFCGGAGLASTAEDYLKFAQMLLNNGRVGDRQLLDEKWILEMKTPHVPEEIMPGNERWGLGVRVIVKEEYQYLPVGTFGWSGAYGSHFWVDQENGIAAVYMKNSLYDGGAGSLTGRNFEQDIHEALED